MAASVPAGRTDPDGLPNTRQFMPLKPFAFPIRLSNADVTIPVCYTRIIAFYKVSDLTANSFEGFVGKVANGFQAAIDTFPIVW
jgi:hypothetical protein